MNEMYKVETKGKRNLNKVLTFFKENDVTIVYIQRYDKIYHIYFRTNLKDNLDKINQLNYVFWLSKCLNFNIDKLQSDEFGEDIYLNIKELI